MNAAGFDSRFLSASLVAAACLLSAGRTLPAQGGAAAAQTMVTGTVYDSVHMAPLRRAAVQIEGTDRLTFTNDEGRFRIDSLPAGSHRLRVEHDLLDSLGVTMRTEPFEVAAGQQRIVDLFVPSSETLVAVSCPAATRNLGPSAIIGRLLDADSDAPVQGGKVSYAWTEISITAGLRRVPRVRTATTGPDGVFRICGLPNQVEGTLQADKQGIVTSEVRVVFEGQPLTIQGLRIGNANTVARAERDSTKPADQPAAGARLSPVILQRGNAVLNGRVVAANGQPMANVRVDLIGAPGAALTNDKGEFSLTGLPSGTQTVAARQLGYAPVENPVELSTRAPASVTITMSKPAQILAPVVVKAEQDQGLERIGFTGRKRAGHGYFVTGDEVMKRAPNVLTDVFRTIPMLRVAPGGAFGNEYVVQDARSAGTGGCVRYMIDGAPWEAIYPGDLDRMMPPWNVGAIEVYHAATVPIQFTTAGNSSCAVIVLWSKQRVEGMVRGKR
jgi:carboxypeptidase family protein